MIGCLTTQALAFLAVFVYATHATQAIAFEWKPARLKPRYFVPYCVYRNSGRSDDTGQKRPQSNDH